MMELNENYGKQSIDLAKAFPDEVLQELPKAGMRLTYVPVAEVITRLNNVLGTGGWSYTIESHWAADNEYTFYDKKSKEQKTKTENWVMAHVRLIANVDGMQCARDGIGGYNTGNPGMDYADGYKSAVSEGLKKAAQALGVGLHLSRKEEALAHSAAQSEPRVDGSVLDLFKTYMSEETDEVKNSVKSYAAEIGASWGDMLQSDFDLIVQYAEKNFNYGSKVAEPEQPQLVDS
jgi:hypothetical protein